MARVKILAEGYASGDNKGHSCSTVTLIQDKDAGNIVVDPGTLASPEILIGKLNEENLSLDDINLVCITHSHMDHYKYVGLFPKAKILDYWGYWEKDVWSEASSKISERISLLKTPGHSDDSISLLVQTEEGIVCVCGDVFWKENFPEKDLFATDSKKLAGSRKKILEVSDYIIPGHGKKFKVKK